MATEDDRTHNEVNAQVTGHVVQAGSISGDVHLHAVSPPGRLTAHVSVYAEDDSNDDPRYRGDPTGDGLLIRPEHPYLDRVWSGRDLIAPSGEGPPRGASGPQLDVKIVNNTARTVFFHAVHLEVARSRPDPRPVPHVRPILFSSIPLLCGSPIANRGGPMADCVLAFHLEHPGHPGRVTGTHHVELGPDGRMEDMGPVLAALGEAGVRLEPGGLEPAHPDAHRASYWSLGPFVDTADVVYDGKVALVGSIEYRWTDLGGARVGGGHGVRSLIFFMNEKRLPASYELVRPSASYHAPLLRADQSDYRVSVPISHALATGEVDRILVRLDAPRSSLHDLTLSLHHDTGVLDCGRISLEYFRP
ncbi:hypothetical protein JOF41_002689 [Saccharothrix coeruleofusca]|uniref:hypothetical protein n=1 Tax=Saccharothrix coeruleofusca TaxID=33919 RepID=UPI001AE1EED6|nr:hypothetical protein [Saccharothrix coeruleofusca]MBP2336511.1 hypothetical protein [Saccharothrix coeruleofusca]